MSLDFPSIPSLKPGIDKTSSLLDYSKEKATFNTDMAKAKLKLYTEIDKYNSQFAFLRSKEKGLELRESLKQHLRFQESLEDPRDIQKSNRGWLQNEHALIDSEGGAYGGELKNQATQFYLLAEEQGIRVGRHKTRTKAIVDLNARTNEFNTAIARGSLTEAKDVMHERGAFLNSMVAEGIFTPQEGEAFLANFKNRSADTMINKFLQENEYIEASEGRTTALKDYKMFSNFSKEFTGSASDKMKTLLLKRGKLLKKADKTYDLMYEKQQYNTNLFNWINGFQDTKEVMSSIEHYRNKINYGLKTGAISNTTKGNLALKELSYMEKFIGIVAEQSSSISTGTFKKHSLLDFTKSNTEVAKELSLSTSDIGLSVLADMRKQLFNRLHVKGDPAQSNVQLYKFLHDINRGSEPMFSIPTITGADKLEQKIAMEKSIDKLMGGTGVLTQESANTFDNFQNVNDANTVEQLNTIVAKNPSLLNNVAEHRSRPENSAFSLSTLDFINRNSQILNLKSGELKGIQAQLANDPIARKVFNFVFNSVQQNMNEELSTYGYYEQIGAQQLGHALTHSLYKDIIGSRAVSGDALRELNALLGSKNTAAYEQIEDRVLSTASQLFESLKHQQKISGLVSVGNTPLASKSSINNGIIGTFSQEPYTFFGGIKQAIVNIDIGMRDVRPLDSIHTKKLSDYINKQFLPAEISLINRVRLQKHNGNIFRLSYIDGNSNNTALRDRQGEHILFDTTNIKQDFTDKVSDTEIYEEIIRVLGVSNVRY